MNDRINMPGGVDKIMHSSVQPWSVGEIFPAVLARKESSFGKGAKYEVLAYGECWRVFCAQGSYHAWSRWPGENSEAPFGAIPAGIYLGNGFADVYDAAYQLAKGLVMAHEAQEALLKSVDFDGEPDLSSPPGVVAFLESIVASCGAKAPIEKALEFMSEEEEAIPADYWQERKALLASDYSIEPEVDVPHWLDRRPAADLGWRS